MVWGQDPKWEQQELEMEGQVQGRTRGVVSGGVVRWWRGRLGRTGKGELTPTKTALTHDMGELTTFRLSRACTLMMPWKYPNSIDTGNSAKSTGYRT